MGSGPLSSTAALHTYIASLLKASDGRESKSPLLGDALQIYSSVTGEEAVTPAVPKPSQFQLSLRVDKALVKHMFRSLEDGGDQAGIARMSAGALAEPFAAAWLCALPNVVPFDNRLDPAAFQVCLQHRLGVPLKGESRPGVPLQQCRFCAADLDTAGHHALVCSSQPHVMQRHNAIRNRVARLCGLGAISYEKEKGQRDPNLKKLRPADLLLKDFGPNDNRDSALDFTVRSPLTPNLLQAGASSATAAAEKSKHLKNDKTCTALGWQCIPMAVNTYGGWGQEATVVFKKVVDSIASASNMKNTRDKAKTVSFVYNTLGVLLARKNAIALIARYRSDDAIGRSELSVASSFSLG